MPPDGFHGWECCDRVMGRWALRIRRMMRRLHPLKAGSPLSRIIDAFSNAPILCIWTTNPASSKPLISLGEGLTITHNHVRFLPKPLISLGEGLGVRDLSIAAKQRVGITSPPYRLWRSRKAANSSILPRLKVRRFFAVTPIRWFSAVISSL